MANITRFMVVSKDRETRGTIQRIIESLGYNLITPLEDGQEALDQIEQKGVQLIVIDWDLKPMPATVFLQKMRANPKFRHNPTMVLAKKLVVADLRLSTELGIEAVVPMPVDPQKTKDTLKRMIDAEEALSDEALKLRGAADKLSAGDMDGALALAKECHGLNGKALEPCRLMGEILVKQAKWPEAENILGKAVQIAPKNSFIAQLLSKVYASTGRHQDAIKMLSEMVKHSPLNIGNFLGLGSAYSAAGDDENAKASLEKAARLDSTNAEAREGLGKIAFKEGDFDAAKEFFANTEKGVELAREFNNVAIGLVAQGTMDKAIQSYQAALSILEGKEAHGIVLYNFGLALKKAGRPKEAFSALANAYLKGFRDEKVYAGVVRLAAALRDTQVDFDLDLLKQVMDLKKGGLKTAS